MHVTILRDTTTDVCIVLSGRSEAGVSIKILETGGYCKCRR